MTATDQRRPSSLLGIRWGIGGARSAGPNRRVALVQAPYLPHGEHAKQMNWSASGGGGGSSGGGGNSGGSSRHSSSGGSSLCCSSLCCSHNSGGAAHRTSSGMPLTAHSVHCSIASPPRTWKIGMNEPVG